MVSSGLVRVRYLRREANLPESTRKLKYRLPMASMRQTYGNRCSSLISQRVRGENNASVKNEPAARLLTSPKVG